MNTRTLCAALILLGTCARPAFSQHVVGGGDPLMMIFAEARYDAIRMLDHLSQTGVPDGSDPQIAAILRRKISYNGQEVLLTVGMAGELRQSTLIWQATDTVPGKCAAIELRSEDLPNIYLSLPTCRGLLLSQSVGAEAARTLIHESVHRFGFGTDSQSEDIASRVSVLIFNTWKAARTSSQVFWADSASDGAPTPRSFATGVWTGSGSDRSIHNQILVWGGCTSRVLSQGCSGYPNTGARLAYTGSGSLGEAPQTAWLPLDVSTAPIGRKFHTALWTGDAKYAGIAHKMLIFGGCSGPETACSESFAVTACSAEGCDDARKNNALYDPRIDLWSPVATMQAPSPRVQHSAVWTSDDDMIVWGGLEGFQNPVPDRALGDGGILNFSDDAPQGRWRPLNASSSSPTPRFGHTAVWTGTEMLVWGGCAQSGTNVNRCPAPLADGAAFDPKKAALGLDPWRPLPPAPLSARVRHSAIWTGRYLVIWGGENKGTVLSDGAIYDSADGAFGQWTMLSALLPPNVRGRRDHSAHYEPLRGRMIISGGASDSAWSQFPSETLIYDFNDKKWSLAQTNADPEGRVGNIAAWVEDSLFVWGGYNKNSGIMGSGGLFNP